MNDHRYYIHNLSSCENNALTGFEPVTSDIPNALPDELSSQLRAGLVESL